jgi:protein-S-isoprenylcysteine O-methyltransferase Ste14
VHLVFDIFQGIGLAAAVGIRPFLPALAAGALASGDVELDFKHTSYAFLQSSGFLLALVIGVLVLSVLERRFSARGDAQAGGIDRSPIAVIILLISAGLAAVLFAGELSRGHAVVWPGYVGGVVCALIGAGAILPIFARVRARLEPDAAKALPLYAEGTAVVFAVLSVVAPPVGPIGLALLIWLLIAGRRRSERKYAGLRILR